MRKVFKALRFIGLSALVLGLMAVSASAAQAASWLVKGATLSGSATVNAKAETEGLLLTKVGLATIEILCTEIKFVGATIETGGTAKGKIHFQSPTGCDTLLNKKVAPECKPRSVGSATAGLIETNAVKGKLILNGAGEELLELAPVTGTSFVELELGTLCSIGNKISISGIFNLVDCKKEGLVDKVEHLFQEGPGSALLFGANKTTIDGSAFKFLTGANLGATFAGHV